MKNFRLATIVVVGAVIILGGVINKDFNIKSIIILIMTVIATFWIIRSNSKRSANIPSEPEPEKKHLELIPTIFEGETYSNKDDMPPDVRNRYDSLILSLNNIESEGINGILQKIGREDLVERFREAEEMMNSGLITEEDYTATKNQILLELE